MSIFKQPLIDKASAYGLFLVLKLVQQKIPSMFYLYKNVFPHLISKSLGFDVSFFGRPSGHN